jgi:FtsZ-interacting cell division protein ZipA
MSDLQISLLAIGVVVIAGVYLFNFVVERGYRRRAEASFKSAHSDVLLEVPVASRAAPERVEPRIEPYMEMQPAPVVDAVEEWPEIQPEPEVEPEPEVPHPVQERPKAATHDIAVEPPAPDAAVEYIARIHASDPIAAQGMAPAMQRSHEIGKPVRWFGLNEHSSAWEAAAPATGSSYIELAVALQLANRAGAVSAEQLSGFCTMVEDFAAEQHAVAECPERQPALESALELDSFCVDVDVLIGLNVVAQKGVAFPATKIRALAEAAGMKLTAEGVFHYCNDHGDSLFSLCNHESAPFLQDQIKQLSTHGVTLVFDVPRVADGVRVFDQMAALAKKMANALNGALVDDNIRPLSDAGIGRIRQQLAGIYARMDLRGINGGSERALRLFS